MTPVPPKPFVEPLAPGRARAIPWISVMVGSAITIVPWIAAIPLLPPAGLLMLLAWRLLARFSLRPWAAAPLGFWDDLVSGQPLGSAVLLWSMCFLVIEVVENRMPFRDIWQDWLIAAVAIAFCLVAGRFIALPHDVATAPMLAAQILISILTFPLAARAVAGIDRLRGPHA